MANIELAELDHIEQSPLAQSNRRFFSFASSKSELIARIVMITSMPRVLSETVMSVGEAAALPGVSTYSATVIRWITHGVSVNGKVIRLEAVRVGYPWKTSKEAVQRFFTDLTAAGIRSDVVATESASELASV